MESSTSTRSAELRKPLLDLQDAAALERSDNIDELDYEHHVSTVSTEIEEEEEASSSFCSEDFIMWVILPTLLFSQFGMAFLMHDVQTSSLSFAVVNVSIVLFVVTAWLYRHACADANVQTIALLLLPEILMDVVLGLVLFNRVELGFMVLLMSMLCLSSFVVCSTATFLYCGRSVQQEENEQGEEEPTTLSSCQVV